MFVLLFPTFYHESNYSNSLQISPRFKQLVLVRLTFYCPRLGYASRRWACILR